MHHIQRRQMEETEVYETPGDENAIESYRSNRVIENSRNIDIDESPLEPGTAYKAFAQSKGLEDNAAIEYNSVKNALESPQARFLRIKMEMKDLENDLKLLQGNAINDNNTADSFVKQNYESMLQGLSSMQLQLTNLENDNQQLLGPSSIENDANLSMQRQLTLKLWGDLNRFKRQSNEENTYMEDTDCEAKADSNLTYEIYCGVDKNYDSFTVTKLAQLEQRVLHLEKTIGTDKSSTNDRVQITVLDALHDLENRMDLLSDTKLDSLSIKMTNLMQDFQNLTKLKENANVSKIITSQEESIRIQQVYTKLESVGEISGSLPSIINKLRSLKTLHDQSLAFNKRVQTLESNSAQIQDILQNDHEMLNELENHLASNITLFENNISSLDQRIEKLLQDQS